MNGVFYTMQITNTNYTPSMTNFTSKSATKACKAENETFSPSFSDPLSYYQNLCKDYPDISFRLDDKSTWKEGEVSLGYKNSMNQVGSNFGYPGQVSVSIDVSVIKKMQQDPEYEKEVRGLIERSRDYHSADKADAARLGYNYFATSIDDANGHPATSQTMSYSPFSTEEQIKALWNREGKDSNVMTIFEKQRQEMLNAFLDITDNKKATHYSSATVQEKLEIYENNIAISE